MVKAEQEKVVDHAPLISVIIPVFNRMELLKRSLKSALGQNWKNLEVIIVDDASEEDVEQVVHEISDKRVIYVRQSVNQGAPAARNRGLEIASGEFIAFLDSDDAWRPDKLSEQMMVFSDCSPNVGVIACGWEKVGSARQPPPPDLSGDVSVRMLVRNLVGSASVPLIKADLLRKVGGFDPTFRSCQDWDLWIRLSIICDFAAITEPLVQIFPQPNSITMNRTGFVAGHRQLSRKFAQEINGLPKHLRAAHHYYMGINFFWARRVVGMGASFLRSILFSPKRAGDIIAFLIHRKINHTF